MKVCDKCRKNGGVLYTLKVKGIQANLCDTCSQKIIEWLRFNAALRGKLL
jgi:hypothetical protein